MTRWADELESGAADTGDLLEGQGDLALIDANDLPLGVDMLDRARDKYPWREMQTLFPFTVEGVKDAVAQAMAMRTVKSTIVPYEELL